MIASRLAGFGTTIFTEMSALAERTGSINLGQGFPDEDGPAEVLEAAAAALRAGHNQYAPLPGVPALREAIAEHQRRFYGLEVDPDGGVQVTFGATEALAAAMLGLLEAGDEVVVFEPLYDSYAAGIAMAGATRRVVTLRPPDWEVDGDALRAAVGAAHPHAAAQLAAQPDRQGVLARGARAGRVGLPRARPDRGRRRGLRAPRVRRRARAAGDAAGDGRAHADDLLAREDVRGHGLEDRLGDRPGRAGRGPCARRSSSSRSRAARRSSTRERPRSRCRTTYYARFAEDLRAKRDRLCAGLEAAGLAPLRPAGTYFVNARVPDGVAFCRELPERAGVVAIPTAVFYDDPDAGAGARPLRVLQARQRDRRGRPPACQSRLSALDCRAWQTLSTPYSR